MKSDAPLAQPPIGQCKFCSFISALGTNGACTNTGSCVYRWSNRLRYADTSNTRSAKAWTTVGYHEDDFPEALRAQYMLERNTRYERNALLRTGTRLPKAQALIQAQEHANTLHLRVILYEHRTHDVPANFWSLGDEYSLLWALKTNDPRTTILIPTKAE